MPVGVFGISVVVVLLLLAFRVFPGVPEEPLGNLKVYSPSVDRTALTVFVEPPTGVLLQKGPGQAVAMQFTNTTANDLRVESVSIVPQTDSCFRLTGQAPGQLAAGASATAVFDLRAPPTGDPDCLGRRAAAIQYSYTVMTADGGHHLERRVLSLSPILITTRWRAGFESFFHIAASLLVPFLLAIATYFIQQIPAETARHQREEEAAQAAKQLLDEQRFRGWQIIFPMLNGYVRDFYTPISRQMDLLLEELQRDTRTGNAFDGEEVMAALLILRTLFDQLGEKVGGYYFRDKNAEDVAAIATNHFWDICDDLAGGKSQLAKFASHVRPTDTVLQARQKLTSLVERDAAEAALQQSFQASLEKEEARHQLLQHLRLMVEVVDFETGALWYPEWYQSAPELHFSLLASQGLGLSDAEARVLDAKVAALRAEIPKECVVD